MNRFLILVSLILVASCSKDPDATIDQTNGAEVSLTASLTDAVTRVSADYSNGESWSFEWDEGDALSAWHSGGCTAPSEFEMGDNSVFTGTLGEGENHRFIYPYEEVTLTADDAYLYPIDISSQDGSLNKTYLINDEMIATSSIEDNTVSTLDMRHVGAFMVVDVTLQNATGDKSYTLTKVTYSSVDGIICNAAKLNMIKGYNSTGLISSVTTGAITADVNELFTSIDKANLAATTKLNIIPFTAEAGNTATITLTIEVSDTATETLLATIKPTVTVANNTAESLPFARTTHNYTNLTVDGSDGFEITGATINDWGVIVESGDLTLTDRTFTASEISATSIPVSDIWTITDSGEITEELMEGVRAALWVVEEDGRSIKIVMPNATSLKSAFYDQDSERGCPALTAVELPSVTHIYEYAFSGSGLTSFDSTGITLGYGKYAFADCSKLVEVTNFSNSSMPDGIFSGCTLLSLVDSSVYIKSVGEYAFDGCSSLVDATIFALDSVPAYAFRGCGFTSFDFTGVEEIGVAAFYGCTKLAEVTNFSVTSISDYAFRGCAFTSFDFTGVEEIGVAAFYSCTKLAEVTNFSVTTISNSLFTQCGLTSFDFTGVIEIEADAFYYCDSLTDVELPSTVTAIGYRAFANSGVTTLTLKWTGDYILEYNPLITIESYEWFYGTPLATIYIPTNTTDAYVTAGWAENLLVEKKE